MQNLVNFITNTLPKPVLVALLYRLIILHFASRILPTIGADSWEADAGVDDGWSDRPTSALARLLLTYRQTILIMVYSHLLCTCLCPPLLVFSDLPLSARPFFSGLVAVDERVLDPHLMGS